MYIHIYVCFVLIILKKGDTHAERGNAQFVLGDKTPQQKTKLNSHWYLLVKSMVILYTDHSFIPPSTFDFVNTNGEEIL